MRQRPDRLRVPRKRAERRPGLAQHPEADVLFGVEREDECVGLDAEGEVLHLLEGLSQQPTEDQQPTATRSSHQEQHQQSQRCIAAASC